MKSKHSSGDDRDLDRLLGRARWPEPEIVQLTRLEEHWQAIARRQRGRRRYAAMTLAASVALVFATLALRHHQTAPRAVAVLQSEPVGTGLAIEPAAVPAPAAESLEPREPTAYERMVLLSARADRERQRGEIANNPAPPRQRKPDPNAGSPTVDELIAVLAVDPTADVDRQLAALASDIVLYEPGLLATIEQGQPAERLAATLVLAWIGTNRSLPVLSDLLGDPATHEAAIVGVCRLAEPVDLKRLVMIEPRVGPRQELLAALLARRSAESIEFYLQLVGDQRFVDEALAASSALADPPVDLFLAFLENPQRSLRVAAAQSLGSLLDVDIVARMDESVLTGVGRQEALLALLLSRDAKSAMFLAAARQDIYLVASVHAAEQELQDLTLTER